MVGDATSRDLGVDAFASCEFALCPWVGGDFSSGFADFGARLSGAWTVWWVETPGSTGPFSDRAASPVLCARGLTIPLRPAQSTARTPTAATDTTPVSSGRRGR